MPRLEYSERFVSDLALIESPRLEARILSDLDNIEMFGEFGSSNIPQSIREQFGDGVRKVAVDVAPLASVTGKQALFFTFDSPVKGQSVCELNSLRFSAE